MYPGGERGGVILFIYFIFVHNRTKTYELVHYSLPLHWSAHLTVCVWFSSGSGHYHSEIKRSQRIVSTLSASLPCINRTHEHLFWDAAARSLCHLCVANEVILVTRDLINKKKPQTVCPAGRSSVWCVCLIIASPVSTWELGYSGGERLGGGRGRVSGVKGIMNEGERAPANWEGSMQLGGGGSDEGGEKVSVDSERGWRRTDG